MNLKIGGKTYEMIMGIKAIDYLDHVYTFEVNGIKFGNGIKMLVTSLFNEDPVALYNCIKAGICTELQKPSNADIEKLLVEVSEKDEIGGLYLDFLNLLRTQPLTKATMKRFSSEEVKAEEKTMEKNEEKKTR